MIVSIQTIDHKMQRYDTCGDWRIEGQESTPHFIINVSDTGVMDFNFLVAIHELIEAYLCRKNGISQERVDIFDLMYESHRPEGDFTEAGNDPKAPYWYEHQFASGIERTLAAILGVDWDLYEQTINRLER